MKSLLLAFFILAVAFSHAAAEPKKTYGTASLMVVVERERGSVAVFDSIRHELLGRVEGLGNLRHATMVFSRDARYAFVIARDGVVSKVDLINMAVEARAKAGENSIGIAISRDNRYIMVCNYEPGGVSILDSDTLKTVKEIPAVIRESAGGTIRSRTVGPLDTADNLMIFGLMEGNAVWVVDMREEGFPVIKKFEEVGDTPYDQLITPDGRYYLVGLLNSDWMGLLDTWKLDAVKKIDMRERRTGPSAEGEKVPLYHIPHLESWGIAGGLAFVPAFGEKRVIVYDMKDWSFVKSIPVAGTPLFVVVRPGGREVWVDNVGAPGSPEERTMDIISVETLSVKKSIDPGRERLTRSSPPRAKRCTYQYGRKTRWLSTTPTRSSS